jgi:prefoldin subunit 5
MRTSNPADHIKRLVEAITESRQKLEEALAELADYSEQLRRVTSDAGQRLIGRS